MTHEAKPERLSRLSREMLETANEMHVLGIMSDESYAKVTMRHVGKTKTAAVPALTGDDIRALRVSARMSQAVFARCLNMTVGHVSKLERGTERATGPALVLLNVIRKHGIEAVL